MKKQFTILSILVFAVFGCFALAGQVNAETEVGGIINSDTTWALINSPYIVTNDILIEKNIILTIELGVIIKFKKGNQQSSVGGFEILNKGSIIAKGNSNNKIVFTSFETNPQLGDWGTIEIVSGGSIDFDNVEIEYASCGINSANASNVIITNSHFSNCGTGIFVTGPATISNNIIENNYSGIIYCGCTYSARDDGTFSYSGIRETEISHNTIQNNIGQGLINSYHAGVVIQDLSSNLFSLTLSNNTIYNNGSGVKFTNSSYLESLLIENNNIYGHSDYNIWFDSSSKNSEINMLNNWWGTIDITVIDSKIYDYYDDYISPLSKVNYKPLRTEFNANAPHEIKIQLCTSWTYSDWSECISGKQTRTIIYFFPENCIDGNPILSQSCQVETNSEDDTEIATQPESETSESNLKETSTIISDGDIIQCQNSSDTSAVYIVKIIGNTKYIRHIVSLDIFNHYKHLKWENLKQVNSLDDYSLSGWVRYNTGPNETAGPTDKVYEINGDQTRHWINMTAEQFLTHGGSEPAIFNINQGELNLYTIGPDVMSL